MSDDAQYNVIFFIILELALIFSFILLVYTSKIFFLLRNYTVEKKLREFTDCLNEYQKSNNCSRLNKKNHMDLLLSLLKKTTLSQEQKIKLVQQVILPKVLNYQKSKNWKKRYQLLSALKISLEEMHYSNLIHLINDSAPIVSIEAVRLGSSCNNWPVYKTILEKLLHCDHTNQLIYIDNLHKNKAMLPFLRDALTSQKDSQLKKIIYDLLLHIGCNDSFYQATKDDSIFGHRNMRLAAIRVLPYTNKAQAGSVLEDLVCEEDWLVRNIAVQSLGVLGDERYLSDVIKLLADPVWWVRVSAAKALVQFGDSGLQALKDYEVQDPHVFSDYAEYFYKIKALKAT